MRITHWAEKFGITVVRCEERPDRPQGDIVYRVVDIFTTRDGQWDPSDTPGGIEPWAREAYLRPFGADDYFDDAGADTHLFARVLDPDGKPVVRPDLVRYWSDGLNMLTNPGYTGYSRATPKDRSGWANIYISAGSKFVPERGEHGPWCWCPEGAADVVTGGGLPNKWHVSTFVVWRAERRGAEQPVEPGPQPTTPVTPPRDEQPLPMAATVAFGATPAAIAPGQAAMLSWDVEGVTALYLDGQGVTGHETRTVRPTATTTYTLRVHFRNGSTRDFQARVAVEAAAPPPEPSGPSPMEPTLTPGATRPPTVRLTAENVAHLKTFPRPPNDNGIGLHFHLDLRDEFIQKTVGHLQSIRATWTLIYAQDAQQARRAAEACWRAGIMPVVRVGKKVDAGDADPLPYVEALGAIGAPPYVQIFNEPEDTREWRKEKLPPGWARIFGRNWAHAALRVFEAGGYPGLQVLTKGAFDAAVDAVNALGKPQIWQRAFFVQHNYAENHPPAYPYDARNQQDSPGQTIHEDNLSVLSFLDYAAWMQERLGFVLPIIGGEGGWLFGAEKDPRYPKVERALHAQYHKEMFDWLRTGVLITGEPLPDYVFSITPWIAGSWTFGGQNWWGNSVVPENALVDTIRAVQAIPPFVRKSSWDR